MHAVGSSNEATLDVEEQIFQNSSLLFSAQQPLAFETEAVFMWMSLYTMLFDPHLLGNVD